MKKVILILAVVLAGCETTGTIVQDTETTISGREIQVYEIDSCEYLGNVYVGNGDFLTHKGNCKFCSKR